LRLRQRSNCIYFRGSPNCGHIDTHHYCQSHEKEHDYKCFASNIEEKSDDGNKRSAIQQLRAICGLCNAADFDASLSHLPLPERRIFGDATDQAILRFSETFGPASQICQEWKPAFELGFDSKRKLMIKGFTCHNGSQIGMGVSAAESASFQPSAV
jgi:magnesium-transporting ATPase (P-type)